MIVAGMNALVLRRSWTPVRALATTAKPGGSGNKNQHWGGKHRKADKSKPQAGTKPELKPTPAPAPALKAKTAPAPKEKPPPTFKAKPPPTLKAKQPTPKPEPTPTPKLEPTPTPTKTSLEPNATENRAHIPLPSPNPPLSAYTLPPSKLRALIDLYHSSTSYITPETLSDAIDGTFAPRRYTPNTSTRYQSYRDLVAQRDELDAEPDRVVPSVNELGGLGYGTVDGMARELVEGGWSTSKGERARMVKAALWGVDPLAKIGLETLLEAKVELDAQEKEQEKEKV